MRNFIAIHPENGRVVVCQGNPMRDAQVYLCYADADTGEYCSTAGDCVLFDDEFYSVFDFERELF